uniref:Uncharacterized protein n=1 Tax=Anguilla anguilla TaxID=7936 RepID=A0A0E9QGC8_ANGAN
MPLFDEGVALDSERDLWVGLGWGWGGAYFVVLVPDLSVWVMSCKVDEGTCAVRACRYEAPDCTVVFSPVTAGSGPKQDARN